MESVIARLLNEFETGKMSRRQLVQTLALVAVGAPVATALAESVAPSPGVAPAAAPWKTVYLDHISYQVSDYKRSVDFYSGLMGWTVIPGSDTGRQAALDINGIGGIIIRNGGGGRGAAGPAQAGSAEVTPAAPTPAPAPGADGAGRGGAPRAPITGVINHISWGVEPWDTETVRAELTKRGLTPRVDTGNGGDIATSKFKSFHVRDPDGWDLQISNQTREKHEL